MSMRTGGGDGELNAEINVTPMVDVMLVLLIIFMITAPIMDPKMNSGVDLTLPTTAATKQEDPKGKLILSIGKKGEVALGDTVIPWNELPAKLSANARVKADKLWIEADKDLPYQVVVSVMAMVMDAGCPGVMLLTEKGDNLTPDKLDAMFKNTKP